MLGTENIAEKSGEATISLDISISTTGWTTFTQFPLAFCGGRIRELGAASRAHLRYQYPTANPTSRSVETVGFRPENFGAEKRPQSVELEAVAAA